MRGDEPLYREPGTGGRYVFPACAGMNRTPVKMCNHTLGVPRMRGDEPKTRDLLCL